MNEKKIEKQHQDITKKDTKKDVLLLEKGLQKLVQREKKIDDFFKIPAGAMHKPFTI